jgi:hypothetical protein
MQGVGYQVHRSSLFPNDNMIRQLKKAGDNDATDISITV